MASETEAKKKKKKKGKKRKGKGKKRPVCVPQPVAQTCAGTCGSVSDNCGAAVSCSCPTGQCCTGQGTCGACLVFVSSARPSGKIIGGLTGADAICQNLAAAAGLPGTYMAWLSDATGSPRTRFTWATVPYTLVNNTMVAANWTALTSGTLAHAIDVTETGAISDIRVWTNTLSNGMAGGNFTPGHCGNWSPAPGATGNTGLAYVTGEAWTEFSDDPCSYQDRGLYCFQQR